VKELVVRSGMVPLQVLDHGGGGAGVLLLHGGGRTSRDWDELAGRLGPCGGTPGGAVVPRADGCDADSPPP
jgi:hypothetical protein